MTKHELVVTLQAQHTDLTQKQIERVVHAALQQITQVVKQDGQFRWPDFGTFKRRARAARPGRNPQTGEPIQIAASTTITFSPSVSVRAALAEPAARGRGRAKAKAAGR